MIPLFKPFVAPEAAQAVTDVLASGYLGQGSRVEEFEDALRGWIGPCAAVASGTAALWLAYELAGLDQHTKVICTSMSCLATAMPFAYLGCEVLWADVKPKTGMLDPDDVELLLHQHPGVWAVVAVDYGGQLPDLARLRRLCDQHGAVLIEDCAHSFGAYGHGLAHAEAYSFQAIKSLTTGDGGALVVREPHLLARAKLKRWFGLDRSLGGFRCEQVVKERGLKAQMNDIAAAIGLANLMHMDEVLTKQRRHAAAYDQAGLGHVSQGGSCWLFTLLVEDRQHFIEQMALRGVQCARVHSRMDSHPIFNAASRDLPGTWEFDQRQCSIPVGWHLSDEDVQQVICAVKESL